MDFIYLTGCFAYLDLKNDLVLTEINVLPKKYEKSYKLVKRVIESDYICAAYGWSDLIGSASTVSYAVHPNNANLVHDFYSDKYSPGKGIDTIVTYIPFENDAIGVNGGTEKLSQKTI
ncbi:MAG: hypothetical protein FWG53_11540 [Clostridiales bacterium]|nr:hypothetical protein [Clostridiales bacterium]